MRGVAVRLGLVLFGLVLAFLLGEGALRVTGMKRARFAQPRHLENPDKSEGIDLYPSDPRGYFDVHLGDPRRRAALNTLGIPHLERLHASLPVGVAFTYSRAGCRDREPPPRTAGVQRVMVIGDSFTEGQGVRAHDVFSRVLERHLADARVEVFNCGRRGRDFPDLHRYFPGLLARHLPDLVVYAMLLNDPVQSQHFSARQRYLNDWILDRRRMASGAAPPPDPWWVPRTVTLTQEALEQRRVGRETTSWYRDMVGAPNREGWLETQRLIRDMNTVAHAHGARFMVVLLPLLTGLNGTYPLEAAHREVSRAMLTANLDFHDALRALRGRDPRTLWVHPVDMHPNELAHALLGDFLAPRVRAALR